MQTQNCENVVGNHKEVSFDHISVGKLLFGAFCDHLLRFNHNGRGDDQNKFVNTNVEHGSKASEPVFVRRRIVFLIWIEISEAIRTLKLLPFCFKNTAGDVGWFYCYISESTMT